MKSFRVWCLSWGEEEAHGCDVVAYDIFGVYPRGQRGVVHVPDTVLYDAASAAEAYADYVHDARDGNESSWPLTFRVRNSDGEIADFEVDREYVTEFNASPIKSPKPPKPIEPATPAEPAEPVVAKEGYA